MPLLVLAVVLSACTSQQPRASNPGPVARAPQGILLLGSSIGVKSVDPSTGEVLFEGSGVPALGDWSNVFTTRVSGRATLLEASDAATGAVVSNVSVPGRLSVRVASADGSLVALMAPIPAGRSPWIPEPRASTTIVVADPTGDDEPTRYRLEGNFEPEAFSTDGESLYLISFLPPTDPVAYRVARLDLGRGKVSPVGTRTKSAVVETMSGTRLEQLPSPDGDMLYTLYTTQPATYAEGHANVGSPVAFIHTLSMDEGWAHCVVLPKKLWGADPSDEAMALSPDGERLYVVDTARDLVAVMDTDEVKVIQSQEVDFVPSRGAETHAIVASDGTLVVASGSRVWTFDGEALTPLGTRTMDASVSALGSGPSGVYVAMPGMIAVIDPSTGKPAVSIPSPAGQGTAFVGMIERA
ncbi:MAG TPA: PQQ-binding-like beta-propeller repeat protein [Actinomycetota bacterium]|nr:PQQ-binding-like beta-propeller repeat protein [Actinomycetota bacterium]